MVENKKTLEETKKIVRIRGKAKWIVRNKTNRTLHLRINKKGKPVLTSKTDMRKFIIEPYSLLELYEQKE